MIWRVTGMEASREEDAGAFAWTLLSVALFAVAIQASAGGCIWRVVKASILVWESKGSTFTSPPVKRQCWADLKARVKKLGCGGLVGSWIGTQKLLLRWSPPAWR